MREQPLIVGAGPAGCAAAITLARSGHRPLLLERAPEPVDKVCGDFLGPDTLQHLRALGCDPAALGAEPVTRVRLVHRQREAEATLPFAALSLSRRVLDSVLQAQARLAGADLRLGHAVRDLPADRPVFLATGKHDLKDHPRPRQHTAIGLKQYLRLASPLRNSLDGTTELTLFPGGYAGLQPVEQDRVALCIAVTRPAFQSLGGTWPSLLAAIQASTPRFAAVIRQATWLLPKPLAVANIPYGFLLGGHLLGPTGEGLFRLGDQAAVIPSLTGDGIAIALHSGQAAADAWLGGGTAATYHTGLSQDLSRQMRLSGALHAAFLSPAWQPWILRAAALPGLVRHAARLTRLTAPPPRQPRAPAGLPPPAPSRSSGT
jgi:flavin-dependent dehydrogenase